METGYVCPKCGGGAFRAEQKGWQVRNCELDAHGAFLEYTSEPEFVYDDGGDSYYCIDCGMEV